MGRTPDFILGLSPEMNDPPDAFARRSPGGPTGGPKGSLLTRVRFCAPTR